MTYHTNHCTCFYSHWNNESFHGEVMVYFNKFISNDILDDNKLKVEDKDYLNLVIQRKIFNKTKYEEFMDYYKEENIIISKEEEEDKKNLFTYNVDSLKPEVLQWLNDNIQDNKENEKMWCVPNDDNLERYQGVIIFFGRQIDALKFINTFSIYKQPTFYFDYFRGERKDIDIKHLDIKEDTEQNKDTIFNYFDCQLLDWENEEKEDDVSLNKEEVRLLIEKYIKL